MMLDVTSEETSIPSGIYSQFMEKFVDYTCDNVAVLPTLFMQIYTVSSASKVYTYNY